MSLANCGDELGKIIRIRQCLELMDNGGAGATIDSLTQLIDEVEPVFDTDTAARRLLPHVIGFLNKCRNILRELMAECDGVGMAVMANRLAEDIDSTAKSNDIYGLVGSFNHYLRDNSKNVLECTPAIGAVTAGGANTGTGTLKLDMLDTYNQNNQSIQNADYLCSCVLDAITGGTNQHQEKFLLQSSTGFSLANIQSCMYPDSDGTLDVGGGNRLQNPNLVAVGTASSDHDIPFENFTANVPDKWSIAVGAAGTNVFEETGAGNYYFGSGSLKILGDAGGTLTELRQNATDFYGSTTTDQDLDPLAHYEIGFYMKSADVVGKISVYMTGTGYTAGATEKATYNFAVSGALASFTFVSGVVKMPKAIPSDMKCVIKVETALGNGVAAYIDGVVLAKMYHSEAMGLNLAVISGSTAFVHDERDPDRFMFSSTNDWAGLFQEWFARRTDPRDITRMKYADIGMHVRSGAAASAELAESKAQ